ncbi:MAG: class I SAM-dependent DNA methyltransferase [Planctomycetes bacterium]|nr:class I SAM-dependent DNA methyltransferase [Planctomycetota bacterium]
MASDLTPAQFVAKWLPVKLPERAASQEHFLDLCRLLGQPTPAEYDKTGAKYTFEKGVKVAGPASKGAKGERGWADVWWRGKFGWEYKTKDKHKDLAGAYQQLLQYREALENPPLLIVSDITRTEIHTNFTGTAKQVHVVTLRQMAEPRGLGLLRRVFTDPHSFRPTATAEKITEEVAGRFAQLALGLRDRGHDPHVAAHFLMKCMFCLFAEDVDLLPRDLFKQLLVQWKSKPAELTKRMTDLFARMRSGGAFGVAEIPWFNGQLFDEAPALQLTEPETGVLILAANQDWASVEPAIFGTLFERSLDPDKRAQIGAHFTSRQDIMLVVEPVVMAPLRREWNETQGKVEKQLVRRRKAKAKTTREKAEHAIGKLLDEYLSRLSSIRILDPACGSGNFLYVAIQQLLNLEKEVITYAARPEIGLGLFPHVRPTQLHGLEINTYATELAQVVIWIGYLQWMRDNGFNPPRDPVLEPLQAIEERDAILDLSDPQHPAPAKWPRADFIIGNPPFLGSKLFRQYGLDDAYIQAMYDAFDLPNTSDLCCYWFEIARRAIVRTTVKPAMASPALHGPRAGLLATQGIRGGDNRKVLKRIKETGDVFMAWSDREWVQDGVAVHVSMVGFDGGADTQRVLDGVPVERINANLTGDLDLTETPRLQENLGIYQRSPEKGAKFEVTFEEANRLLSAPNPNGRSSFEVVHPWINGKALVSGRPTDWIIDFNEFNTESEAAGFEAAFELVRRKVKRSRQDNRDPRIREQWWQFRRSGEGVREAASRLDRLLGTTMVAKHRLFAWIPLSVQPDKTIPIFARSDDYFFGVLHSSIHELWARRMGTQLREAESGFRYTPTTCFETFPLPWSPGEESEDDPAYRRVADAARELNEQRERWLNPPEWIDRITRLVDAMGDFSDVPEEALPLIRQSAIMAMAAKDQRLKKRTLTNLYNERPMWLRLAHEKLDRAVLAAYAATDPDGDWSEDWAEVWIETGAGQPLPDDHPLIDRRRQSDQRVLASLLRLNLDRAR